MKPTRIGFAVAWFFITGEIISRWKNAAGADRRPDYEKAIAIAFFPTVV
ncbi:MAG: hypothetical protein IAG10_26740 [Planctomycetaceae bacterium]|nr:hypothetical protein [Planctomycetaceae bacterium]